MAMVSFLTVSNEVDLPLAPSEPVDDAWHVFLLHTRTYAEFCRSELGCFAHHEPGGPSGEGHATAYHRTLELLRRRYGELDPELWPEDGANCRCSG
jgi:hypothetical protein